MVELRHSEHGNATVAFNYLPAFMIAPLDNSTNVLGRLVIFFCPEM